MRVHLLRHLHRPPGVADNSMVRVGHVPQAHDPSAHLHYGDLESTAKLEPRVWRCVKTRASRRATCRPLLWGANKTNTANECVRASDQLTSQLQIASICALQNNAPETAQIRLIDSVTIVLPLPGMRAPLESVKAIST